MDQDDPVRPFWKSSDYGFSVAVGQSRRGFHVRFERDDGNHGKVWDTDKPWHGPYSKAIAENIAHTLTEKYLETQRGSINEIRNDELSGSPSLWRQNGLTPVVTQAERDAARDKFSGVVADQPQVEQQQRQQDQTRHEGQER